MNWQDRPQKRLEQFSEGVLKAHEHSANHRQEIENSEISGCFYCCTTFPSKEVTEWIDENSEGIGQCALCPRCGIDSVIGSRSGFPMTEEFLSEMKNYWF